VKHVSGRKLSCVRRAPALLEIAKRVGVSRPMVWRWQQRFAEEGIEGLLRNKTRPPGIPPVPQAEVHAVVERTLREPPAAVARRQSHRPLHAAPSASGIHPLQPSSGPSRLKR
jgi:Homeodomain-like domain